MPPSHLPSATPFLRYAWFHFWASLLFCCCFWAPPISLAISELITEHFNFFSRCWLKKKDFKWSFNSSSMYFEWLWIALGKQEKELLKLGLQELFDLAPFHILPLPSSAHVPAARHLCAWLSLSLESGLPSCWGNCWLFQSQFHFFKEPSLSLMTPNPPIRKFFPSTPQSSSFSFICGIILSIIVHL